MFYMIHIETTSKLCNLGVDFVGVPVGSEYLPLPNMGETSKKQGIPQGITSCLLTKETRGGWCVREPSTGPHYMACYMFELLECRCPVV